MFPILSTAKNRKETKNGNRNWLKSYIFTYTRQDVKLHSHVQQPRHSRTMSQSLLCGAPNAKSSCFTSTCLYTRTKLLMSSTIVFDVGQPLVSMSIISDDHLQSHCTISMPVCQHHYVDSLMIVSDVDGQPILFLFMH